jgi:hypothetical protein
MKNDITSILDQLLQMFRDPDCNVNTMWEFFKQTLSGYLLSMMFEIVTLFLGLMVTSFLLLFE